MNGEPDDPRFEWVEVTTVGGPEEWIRGRCHHLTPVPVRAHPTGELVARLCPDCDAQLPVPAEPVWRPTA
jgi:hypothetical protein